MEGSRIKKLGALVLAASVAIVVSTLTACSVEKEPKGQENGIYSVCAIVKNVDDTFVLHHGRIEKGGAHWGFNTECGFRLWRWNGYPTDLVNERTGELILKPEIQTFQTLEDVTVKDYHVCEDCYPNGLE